MFKKKLDNKGFSPIEVVIVLLVIAVMIAVIYKRYEIYKEKMFQTAITYDIKNINLILTLYKVKNGKYPEKLDEIYKNGYLLTEDNKSILSVIKFENGHFVVNGNVLKYDKNKGKVYIEKIK